MVPMEFCFIDTLNKVQMHLHQEINLKPASMQEMVQSNTDELDRIINPAIVLAVSEAFKGQGKKSETLAEIIQYIFMANKIHKLMQDHSNIAEEHRQFPVLIGDLFYGKFFLVLCRGQLLSFLDPIAQVMITMSEGGISRWLARDKELSMTESLKIIEKESASLTALAARLSAELAGVSIPLQRKIEMFGWELGLAWGAWKERLDNTEVQSILQRANTILNVISSESQLQLRPLREMYLFMVKQLNTDYTP